MGLFSRLKKVFKVERAHESQPCVPLKYTPTTAQNHPHRLDKTPGGADAIDEGRKEAGRKEKKKRFWRCRLLHFFRRRAGTYNVAKAEKVNLEAGSFLRLTDELHDLHEAPTSEVLFAVQEQLEQDVLQHQDIHTPVSLTEEDQAEELDKDQTSLQQIVEIHDLGEAPDSEVLPAPEEQLEQDVLQPQDAHTPDSSTGEDEAEEADNSHIFWQYEFGHKLGEGGYVHAGTRCKDGLKVAVKIADKTPDMPYIRVPGHPKRLPIEIGLTLMANKGPSVSQIIKLLDWQDDPDHYVMVLERAMPSMSMFNFVKLRQRLDEKMARHVMWQVIHATNICCERGVFHRDIKLENLLVNPDTLEVKLIDFGCGTLMKDSAYMAFNGTEMFCPPEFDVDGRYHAKPATVWSLGFLLFVMLYGYYPDDKDLHRISKKDWSEPDLSQECCQMICDCLQPDPQRRLVLEKMQLHDWFMIME
ncbi:serine/threonine-protein kinase pim-2-like [Sinocyclocheilus rhinocerous]|uniref:serine/threonine-protein kinase pim-2-like n=1 Tax=Sinocyclocheilus rhinocerous TaxID=307959 RepID=UPI0007B9903C|nr:PREDICTED: serine/threonine-protein kinase pim-2-like [Sinocyclocheilus rhinocerous]